jgi:hypothetical protein
MKRITTLIFASLIIALGFSADTFAQTKSKPRSINNRQQYQQKRIVRGVKSGELTSRETHRLEREQYQIHRQEVRFRHSGDGLSHRERYRLQRQLNQSSRHIYKQKHDRQDYQYPKKRL